jgi:Zn finger protein HypA/HybF involved in hydrogenase expression
MSRMPSAHHKRPKVTKKTDTTKSYGAKKASDIIVQARHLKPGLTNCLGWCGKKFQSPNTVTIRYCPKCSQKKNDLSRNLSFRASEVPIDTSG